jgi:hypothetical protein
MPKFSGDRRRWRTNTDGERVVVYLSASVEVEAKNKDEATRLVEPKLKEMGAHLRMIDPAYDPKKHVVEETVTWVEEITLPS